jgi:hypothetical protein
MSITFEQKKAFLKDVRYVLAQARALKDYFETGAKASLIAHPFEQTIHNALVESSLSFLRKVNEFFGHDREESVRLFLPTYKLQFLWEKADVELLNDRVMHLSLEEAQNGKIDWTDFYRKHLGEAERRFAEFYVALEQEHPEYLNEPEPIAAANAGSPSRGVLGATGPA